MLILLAIGCSSKQELIPAPVATDTETAEPIQSKPEPQYCEEISNLANLKFDRSELQPTYIVDYQLRDGCICIVYQYSGCKKATSYLSWDGHWPSEFKPVVAMKLAVRSPGMCDMLLTDSACFSIKKLSFGGDEVSVTLNDPQNRIDIDFTKYQ